MDIFFQLYDRPMHPIVASLLKKMNNLHRVYDKKATLNMHHSETIVEMFRYCVRKDLILSVALDSGFEGFVFEETSQATEVEEQSIELIQPNPMELESQTRCEWLCSRKPLISQFEATLDGLTGDGQSIINEFVDWVSAGPTF